MPLEPYKQQIVEFSETYQFCKEFGLTPRQVKEWKQDDPHEFMCFRSFFAGLSKSSKSTGDIPDGKHNNRHTSKLK